MQYRKGMKLQLENPAGTNLVRSYGLGQLHIGERTHSTSLIVTATAIIAPWRPTTAQELTAADIDQPIAFHDSKPSLGFFDQGYRRRCW